MTSKNRIPQFDIARTLAILCVILCHSAETIYDFNNVNSSHLFSRLFLFTSFTAGRIGVPVFLFLSGALLLKKEINTDSDVFRFYRKNLLPLLYANAIWTVIYNLFLLLSGRSNFVTRSFVIRELLLLQKIPSPQMWYLPMIIGMYLGIPFLAKIVKTFSFKALFPVLVIGFLACFAIPFANLILRILAVDYQLTSFPDFSLFGGAYVIYILAGYYMTSCRSRIQRHWPIYTVSILCFIFAVCIQITGYARGVPYNIWYDNPLLLISSAGLFIYMDHMDETRLSQRMINITDFISRISFSIFFIHEIILYYVKIPVMNLNIISPLKVILLFLLTAAISAAVSLLFTKNRFISKYAILYK